MLFWRGIKESIKGKTRHKKDNCKTFAELITAARYGEKELGSTQPSRKIARSNQAVCHEFSQKSPPQPSHAEAKPAWITDVCSAMAWGVREILKDQIKPADVKNTGNDQQRLRDWSSESPTCYRCGQVGHVQVGCRNTPFRENKPAGNGRRLLPRGRRRS